MREVGRKNSVAGWVGYATRVAAVALFGSTFAGASVTATISVAGAAQTGDMSIIVVSFDGFQEVVRSDSTSTANSIASGFAALFSRDYLALGLCASAKGNVIKLQLKTGGFGPVTVLGGGSSFQMATTGFATETPPPPQFSSITLTNIGSNIVHVSKITLSGADAVDFAVGANGCGQAVRNGSQCTITLMFLPFTRGSKVAQLQLTSDGSFSPSTIQLSGTW